MSYVAPLKDMLFVIRHLAGIDEVARLPGRICAFPATMLLNPTFAWLRGPVICC